MADSENQLFRPGSWREERAGSSGSEPEPNAPEPSEPTEQSSGGGGKWWKWILAIVIVGAIGACGYACATCGSDDDISLTEDDLAMCLVLGERGGDLLEAGLAGDKAAERLADEYDVSTAHMVVLISECNKLMKGIFQ